MNLSVSILTELDKNRKISRKVPRLKNIGQCQLMDNVLKRLCQIILICHSIDFLTFRSVILSRIGMFTRKILEFSSFVKLSEKIDEFEKLIYKTFGNCIFVSEISLHIPFYIYL